jgi:hypothetical protein
MTTPYHIKLTYAAFLTNCAQFQFCRYTVNRKIFVVKIFSDRLISTKTKRTKIVRIINTNAVWGRLSENYFTRKFNCTKYSRFL